MSMSRNLRRLFGKKSKVPARRNRAFLEPLEPRILLSAVTAHWIGGSGNWSDPTHWDIGAAQNNTAGTTYQVVINAANNPTVTLDEGVTIDSLNNADTVVVQTGATSVTQQTTNSGSIQIAASAAQLNLSGTINETGNITANVGTLNLSNATLTANGATAQVIASGTVDLGAINIYAENGGTISLPGATAYDDGVTANYTIHPQASGGD